MPLNLTADQQDALCEIVNIGVVRAAASLSDLIGSRILLTVPSVTLYDVCDLRNSDLFRSEDLSTAVVQQFHGVISGRAVLLFSQASGRKLGQVLGGLDTLPDGSDIDMCGILTEVGNILLNAVLGALANTICAPLTYSVPKCSGERMQCELLMDSLASETSNHAAALVTSTEFRVAERSISGSLLTVFELGSIERVIAALDSLIVLA